MVIDLFPLDRLADIVSAIAAIDYEGVRASWVCEADLLSSFRREADGLAGDMALGISTFQVPANGFSAIAAAVAQERAAARQSRRLRNLI